MLHQKNEGAILDRAPELGSPPAGKVLKDWHVGQQPSVLVVTTHAPGSKGWGGAVKSGSELADLVARLFPGARHLCSDANNIDAPIKQDDAQRISAARILLYKSNHAKKQGFGLGAIQLLFREIRASDVVYVSGVSTWPVTLASAFSLLLGKPYIVALHGGLLATHMDEIRSKRPLKRLFYERCVLPLTRRAAAVRTSSAFETNDAELELPRTDIVAIPNTFKVEEFPYYPKLPASDGTHLIFIGRLERDKGILQFIRIWQEYSGPSDSLRLLGSGTGEYAEAVKALASADQRIHLLGELPRDKVFEELAKVHALVLPSGLDGTLRENFGNVVVEALAAGRAAIVSRGLAWDHLPEHGLGWTFELSHEGVGDCLKALLRSDHLHDPALPGRCRAFAETHFSSSAVSKAVAALIQNCAAKSQ